MVIRQEAAESKSRNTRYDSGKPALPEAQYITALQTDYTTHKQKDSSRDGSSPFSAFFMAK